MVDDEITSYIQANRGTYTDQAIREKLIAVGHEPTVVDAAFSKLGLVPPADAPPMRGPSGLVELAWGAFIVGGVSGLLGFLLAGSSSAEGSLPLFLGSYAAAGLIIIFVLRWAVRKFDLRGLPAVLVGIALIPVFGALMIGTCSAGLA